MNIFQVFTKTAAQYPAKEAIYYKEGDGFKSVSYSDLLARAWGIGKFLKDNGVQPGDRVAVALENHQEYPAIPLAVFCVNAVFVPIDYQLPPAQIAQLLMHSGAKIFLMSEKIKARLGGALPDINRFTVDSESFRKATAGKPDHSFNLAADPQQLAALFYTSGTMEAPKAVMLTHQNLLVNVSAIIDFHLVLESDRIVAMLPLHHTYAFTTTLLTPLMVGAAIVYPSGLSSADLLSSIKATRATVFVGVPQIYSLMARGIKKKLTTLAPSVRFFLEFLAPVCHFIRRRTRINLSRFLFAEFHRSLGGSLRFFVSGGAKLDREVAEDFERWGFTMLEGYGLTETSPVVSFNPPQRYKIGSVGKPITGVTVKIIDPDAKGVGEVAVCGPNVMAGYYQMEQETRSVIKEGWFYTGDLGYLDQESYLYLVGRKKEIIVLSSGKKVVPEDVEKYYSQTPFIKEIAILANPSNSGGSTNEQMAGIIVIDEDYFRAQNEANIRERLKWELDNLSAHLPPYKRLHGFVIDKESLPRTRLGKIMRYKLPALYADLSTSHMARGEGRLLEQGAENISDISQSALLFVEEALQRKVNLQDHLELDLGLDSLGRIELLLSMQEKLKLELPDAAAMEFFMCTTIEELLRKLKKIIPAQAREKTKPEHTLVWGKILSEPLHGETAARINLLPGWGQRIFNIIMISILKVIFRVLFLLRVKGRENINLKGPYLICPNHTSYLDGLFILCALPFKVVLNTYFVGFSAVFEHPALKPFVSVARLIPLEVSFNLVEALKAVTFVLRNGKIVCYFPEGQRSIDGELNTFKKGVGILIRELNMPVVPVYLEGAFKTWNRTQRFPHLAPVTVHFGKSMNLQDLLEGESVAGEEAYRKIALGLQQKVAQIRQCC